MGLSQQEYKSRLRFPPPGDLPDPGIKLKSPMSSALAGGFFFFKSLILYHLGSPMCMSICILGFPGSASGKEYTCQCRRHRRCGFSPRVEKIPWRTAWQPTPAFLPGESHRQRSLEGYSPWGGKRVRHD